MIAVNHKHEKFDAPVSYNMKKTKKNNARLLYTNMAGSVRSAMVKEFDIVAARNPNVKRPALHIVISLGDDEHLTDEEFRYVLQYYISEMGFERCQYAAWLHLDEPHEHIHATINRVTPSGKAVSDSYDYRRQEKVMRDLEIHFGLRRVMSSKEVPIDQRRRKESKIEKALGTLWRVTRLSKIVHAVIDAEAPAQFSVIREKLANRGVGICLCQSAGKNPYIYYEFEGQSYNARNVDAASSLRGLIARGVSLLLESWSPAHTSGTRLSWLTFDIEASR